MSEQTQEPKQEPVDDKIEVAPDGDMVPRELLNKNIKSKQNFAERVKFLEKELADKEMKILKEKDDQKAINEILLKENEGLKSSLQQVKEKEVQSYKLGSLKKELEKMGANKESMESLLKLADVSAIKFDEENKVTYGVEEVAKAVKASIPIAFGVSQSGASHAAPNAMPADVSVEGYQKLFATGQWTKMSKDDRKAYEAKLFEARGVSVKK